MLYHHALPDAYGQSESILSTGEERASSATTWTSVQRLTVITTSRPTGIASATTSTHMPLGQEHEPLRPRSEAPASPQLQKDPQHEPVTELPTKSKAPNSEPRSNEPKTKHNVCRIIQNTSVTRHSPMSSQKLSNRPTLTVGWFFSQNVQRRVMGCITG